MRTAQFINGQYLDQTALNLLAGDAASGIRQAVGTWALPGLVHPEAIAWSVSGSTLTANCAYPFAVQFEGGIIATALGTTPGTSGSTYNIQLSGFIPTAGSQAVYINASYFSLGQTQETVVGPPQGNPAFNPTFAPFNFYTEQVDSIAVLASLTPPDNASTFGLVQVNLTAGTTGVTLGELGYQFQILSSRILGVQMHYALESMNLTQEDAGVVWNIEYPGVTVTLPSAAQSAGYPFMFAAYNSLGSGYSTIQGYGSDQIQLGGNENYFSNSISIMSAGFVTLVSDGIVWIPQSTANMAPITWNASGQPPSPLSISTSGGVQTPYSITASGATNLNQLTTLAQVEMHSGVVGDTRNLIMNVPAASYTSTLTADEILVATMLGGSYFRLASFNQTINLAVTGAGGMDTGAPPVSGYVAVYAIYNPTTGAAALLATNATTTLAPSTYSGAYMPAGYTASALVSVWPTGTTGQLVMGLQYGRDISFAQMLALTTTAETRPITALSISTIVPMNAKTVTGSVQATATTTPTGYQFSISSMGGVGIQYIEGYVTEAESMWGIFARVPIYPTQTLYYAIAESTPATATGHIYISGYSI